MYTKELSQKRNIWDTLPDILRNVESNLENYCLKGRHNQEKVLPRLHRKNTNFIATEGGSQSMQSEFYS